MAKKNRYEQLSEDQKRIYQDRIKCQKAKLFGSADGLQRLLEADGVDVAAVDTGRRRMAR